MLLDEGILKIYGVSRVPVHGVMQETLDLRCEAWYGALDVGTIEWYHANAHNVRPAGKVRVWRNLSIQPGDIVRLPDGRAFEVERRFHGYDDSGYYTGGSARRTGSGMEVTDMVLKTPGKTYQFP